MAIEQMRKDIMKVYPGEKWEKKVKRMPDAQIIAIYNTFLREKKIK